MALDSQDFELMKSLRKTMRESGEATVEKIDRLLEAEAKMLASAQSSLKNDERLVDAFNRMAAAMESLSQEVRQLREELAPSLDKPKLPAPGGLS